MDSNFSTNFGDNPLDSFGGRQHTKCLSTNMCPFALAWCSSGIMFSETTGACYLSASQETSQLQKKWNEVSTDARQVISRRPLSTVYAVWICGWIYHKETGPEVKWNFKTFVSRKKSQISINFQLLTSRYFVDCHREQLIPFYLFRVLTVSPRVR